MTTFTAPMYRSTRTAAQILADLGDVPAGDKDWAWGLSGQAITALPMADRPYYLTPAQAAQILHVSRQTLSRLAEAGRLAHVRPDGGGMRRYVTAAVYDYAQSGARTPRARAAVNGSPAGAHGGTGAPPGDPATPSRFASEGCAAGTD
jgi:excisionase family DNA binding protein